MIKQSEQLNDLLGALAKAQGDLKDAIFDSQNPHFKSKYASLSSGLQEIRPVFSKHGLSISQFPCSIPEGYFLVTLLGHASGQWIQSWMKLTTQKQDMQGVGAALTYARRQMAFAVAGIAGEEDDDGNSISAPPTQQPRPAARPQVAPQQAPQRPPNQAPGSGGKELSEAQIKRFWAMTKSMGWSIEDTYTAIKQQSGKDKPDDMTREEYTLFTTKLQIEIDKKTKKTDEIPF
jgi:hypothetical protein